MIKKFKILAVFVCLSLTLGLMSNTYSRYIADTTNNFKIDFAKWEVIVNTVDITASASTSIDITPTMYANPNIASNTIAPSSSGYFDILIDPSNTDVSFNYSIELELLNLNLTDIVIGKYALLDDDFNGDDDSATKLDIVDNTIEGSLSYGNLNNGTVTDSKYSFNSFTIRVYFEWIEGKSETLNDEADTQIGVDAAANDTQLQIQATMHFEQKLS